MRVGIDVGGTNTDAVLMDGARVVAFNKAPTTRDVTSGIVAALRGLPLAAHPPRAVMLGTTHLTNAIVERKGLARTAVIRIGAPATAAIPPLADFPDDLRAALGGQWFLIEGGHEFDGREINPLDTARLREIAARLRDDDFQAVALCAVFAPLTRAHEERAREIVQNVAPEMYVSVSHQIGRLGLLERENATILNASLSPVARRIVSGLRDALKGIGLNDALYFSQNDGTLMATELAEQYPILTVASGPTNSMRGAAFLSGVKNAVVVDIGGTTTDVGVLQNGFPREAGAAVSVGGVRTNFRMPDVYSFGLGGGSVVRISDRAFTIGPDSVGYLLTERARVFGGDVLTASDVAVAARFAVAQMGDPARVAHLAANAREIARAMQAQVERAIDRMKTRAENVPVILVGGGSCLIEGELAGASEVIRPPHAQVANAIGAAIAQASGEVDRVYDLSAMSRGAAVEDALGFARERAIRAGALPTTIEVVEVEEVPLTYLPSNAVRIRVKVAGEIN
ncbi:MAG: hydantoinase/oxoprolinase family protein [Chloroflexi bacterium]|nr:hydantoinase/oxoprolinase family protein [Chloroflexota bacterium]